MKKQNKYTTPQNVLDTTCANKHK